MRAMSHHKRSTPYPPPFLVLLSLPLPRGVPIPGFLAWCRRWTPTLPRLRKKHVEPHHMHPCRLPHTLGEAGRAGAGILDVEVRLTAQEKLRTLVLASALGLKADRTADFIKQEKEALRQFQDAYEAYRIDWFRGKRMPSDFFELVALMPDPARSDVGCQTKDEYCVRGLLYDDDIKKFHEIMSQRTIRR